MSIFGSQEEQLSLPASDVDEESSLGSVRNDEDELAQESVSEDRGISDEDDDDDLGRPRHAGSRNQWRYLTRLDRQVSEAQEKLEDEDLSIHLYNAHMLKTRARRPANDLSHLKTWQSKDRWRRRGEWVPNNLWTAWPLEETIVPRSGTSHVNGSLALHHPAQELEQHIMARITAYARHEMYENLDEDPHTVEFANDSDATPTQSMDASSQSEVEHETSMKRRYEALQTPLPLADDDKAWHLLHPVIRRTISSLDRLLETLHRARQNRYGGASDSEPDTEASGSGIDSDMKGKKRSRTQSRKRRRSTNVKNTRAHQSRIARDWSEIVGHAARSGWDGAVIERTAARCSDLFDERLTIRTIAAPAHTNLEDLAYRREPSPTANRRDWFCPEEHCKRHMEPFRLRKSLRSHVLNEHGYTIPWVRHDAAIKSSMSESGSEEEREDHSKNSLDAEYDRMHNGIHLDGFLQPITIRPDGTTPRGPNTADG